MLTNEQIGSMEKQVEELDKKAQYFNSVEFFHVANLCKESSQTIKTLLEEVKNKFTTGVW